MRKAARHHLLAAVIVPLSVSMLALGCDPSPPTEERARAWAESDSARLDAFSAEVLSQVEQRHLLSTVAEDDPHIFELEAQRGHDRAVFRETSYPVLARDVGFLGSRVRLLGNPDDAEVLGESGTADAALDAGVRAAEGVDFGGKKLGQGVYVIDEEGGGTGLRVGYELEWETAVGGRNVRFSLIMPARAD